MINNNNNADDDWMLFPSIVDVDDTPHRAPLHKLWFYRGSEQLQICLFLLTGISSIFFGLGYKFGLSSKLLWALVTAMQSRAPILNDGSDRYLRCILFWCMLLPLDTIWSLNKSNHSYYNYNQQPEKKTKEKDEENNTTYSVDDSVASESTSSSSGLRRRKNVGALQISSPSPASTDSTGKELDTFKESLKPIATAASLGLTLQIVFMYIGTILNRFPGSTWFPPELTAVHYAMSSTFAVREWAASIIQAFPTVSKIMTASAMMMETMCPLLCFVAPADGNSWRHIPAFLIATLHLGLLIAMRLPQWQLLGIICNVIWIPPNVWESFGVLSPKKTNIPPNRTKQQPVPSDKRSFFGSMVHKGFSYFFLIYSLYNFGGEQGWIKKHDNGDIGEALQFSQYWKMYGPDPPPTCHGIIMTGRLLGTAESSSQSSGTRRINILRALKTGDWGSSSVLLDEDSYHRLRNDDPVDMSYEFASWRWENAINKWAKPSQYKQGKESSVERSSRLARFLCIIGNKNNKKNNQSSSRKNSHDHPNNDSIITHVEIAYRTLTVNPIGAGQRFSHNNPAYDSVFEVDCATASSYL
eukprot:scaffold82447_cov52-Attheya_sp.AAC.3